MVSSPYLKNPKIAIPKYKGLKGLKISMAKNNPENLKRMLANLKTLTKLKKMS